MTNIKTQASFKAPFFQSDKNEKPLYKKPLVVPAVNIDETAEHYLIAMAAPGFKKEDFKIAIVNDIISISAAKKASTLKHVSDRCEYDYTSWTRSFTLPTDADTVLAKGKYQDGELIIRIPRGDSMQTSEPLIVYVY